MIVKRGDLVLSHVEPGEVVLVREGQGEVLVVDADEARWLMVAGLPVALSAVPSEAPATIAETPSEDGQIPGQLRIE